MTCAMYRKYKKGKYLNWKRDLPFPDFFWSVEREREGEREREEGFLRRFTGIRRSKFVRIRTKVHHLDEGYAWVSKMRDFIEDPQEGIWGNQGLRV